MSQMKFRIPVSAFWNDTVESITFELLVIMKNMTLITKVRRKRKV